MVPGSSSTLVNRALDFVREQFEDHRRPTQAFRYRFRHTLRVLRWAQRLQSASGDGDLLVITLAVLFHDVGWAVGEPHQDVSSNVAARWLREQSAPLPLVSAVCAAVRHHNQRALEEATLEERIVMDADLLDETGVLGFAFDAMTVANSTAPSYDALLTSARTQFERVSGDLDRVRTPAGRRLLTERLGHYRRCVEELAFEVETAELL